MNNTSSQAAASEPQAGSFQGKNKQSELGKILQTRISKEEDSKMCSKVLNTESFVPFIGAFLNTQATLGCGMCEKVDIIIDPQ